MAGRWFNSTRTVGDQSLAPPLSAACHTAGHVPPLLPLPELDDGADQQRGRVQCKPRAVWVAADSEQGLKFR